MVPPVVKTSLTITTLSSFERGGSKLPFILKLEHSLQEHGTLVLTIMQSRFLLLESSDEIDNGPIVFSLNANLLNSIWSNFNLLSNFSYMVTTFPEVLDESTNLLRSKKSCPVYPAVYMSSFFASIDGCFIKFSYNSFSTSSINFIPPYLTHPDIRMLSPKPGTQKPWRRCAIPVKLRMAAFMIS